MYPIDNFVGQTIRRIVFLLESEDKRLHFLFGVLEVLAPDSDQTALINTIPHLDTTTEMAGGKRLCVAIDVEKLSVRMAECPWVINKVADIVFAYDTDGYHWGDKEGIISSSRNESNEMMSIMPLSRSSLYYRMSEHQETICSIEEVMKNKGLREQLTKLSEKYLGYDAVKHQHTIGNWLLLWYNPVYKDIDMTEKRNDAGIYIRVNFRPNMMHSLIFKVTGKDRDGNVLNMEEKTLTGQYLMYLPLSDRYDLLDIEVTDEKGVTIDFFKDLAFIRKISVNFNVNG